MPKIYELSAINLAKKIKAREISCFDVAKAFIERISNINTALNALQQFNPERILAEAIEADKVMLSGNPLGKLHGVPITIKDALYVKGFSGSKGFLGFLNGPADKDATIVARLKKEGAIILGITNTPELLLSYETDNLIYGRTVNPYDFSRVPGGSSGGEAAIICAGGSPLGIGTDAGGSIRQPAHYCGICGHKPTQFVVPMTGNIPANGSGLVAEIMAAGPMAREIDDLILAMEIIAGIDDFDPHVSEFSLKPIDCIDTTSLRVAYFYDIGNVNACPETRLTLNKTLDILRAKGLSVKEASPPEIENTFRLHWETFMWGGDKGAALAKLYKLTGQKEKSPLATVFFEKASHFSMDMAEFKSRMLEVERFRYAMMKFMENFDLILCPVAATPARYHGETPDHLNDFVYTTAFNLTGFPASALPCGMSKEGLPIGLQLVAKPFQDHVSLALAKILQNEIGVFAIPELDIIRKNAKSVSSFTYDP